MAVIAGHAKNSVHSIVITITTLGKQDLVTITVLVDSGVKDNFISQYTVKELGLVSYRYTRVWTLDSYKIAVYSNYTIKFQLTDSYGQRCTR